MRFCLVLSALLVCSAAPCPALLSAQANLSAAPQFTPEQIAKMPVTALPVKQMKLLAHGAGWASTGNRILFTTDNGAHWKDISPPVTTEISGQDRFSNVFFLDAQRAWVLYPTRETPDTGGDLEMHLAATTNGGETWSEVALPRLDPRLEILGSGSITFSDELHGWVDLSVLRWDGALFSTTDGGRTWRRAKGDLGIGADIVASSETDLWMAYDQPDFKLFVSHDRGDSVQEVSFPIPPEVPADAYPYYGLPVFKDSRDGYEEVTYRTSGARSTVVLFATTNGGRDWKLDRTVSGQSPDSELQSSIVNSTWMFAYVPKGGQPDLLKVGPGERITAPARAGEEGSYNCESSFPNRGTGWILCPDGLLSTVDGGTRWDNITPRARNGALTTDPLTPEVHLPPVKILRTTPVPMATGAAPILNTPPDAVASEAGLASGTSKRLGFDKSDVLLPSEMQKWWNASPYYDVGLYLPISAPMRNRHNDRRLVGMGGPAWIKSATAQGWGVIPIWFGLQAPCAMGRNYPFTISTDEGAAKDQGRNQARQAIDSSNKLGLDGGIIYLDLEEYDRGKCSAAVRAYLNGWIDEMTKLGVGYIGVYGGRDDSADFPNGANDNVWFPGKDSRVTVWGIGSGTHSAVSDSNWPNRQRIHQYKENIYENWGGTNLKPFEVIDPDIIDATIYHDSGTKTYSKLTPQLVTYPGSALSYLTGINNEIYSRKKGLLPNESLGVYYESSQDYPGLYAHGLLDRAGALSTFTFPQGNDVFSVFPNGINNLNQAAGYYFYSGDPANNNGDDSLHAFLYNAGKYTTIAYPGREGNEADGVNDAGWVVGTWWDSSGADHCFLYKDGSYTSFDGPGETGHTVCSGINGFGQIVGFYSDTDQSFLDDAES